MSSFSFRPQSRRSLARRGGTLIKVLGITAVSAAGLALAIQHTRADEVPRKDQNFLYHAAEAGNTEMLASKLALEKTRNLDVKNFATLMIDEYVTIGDQLKQLAAAKKIEIPDQPSLTQRAKIAILSKMDGITFDQQYVRTIGIFAHKDAMALFKNGISESTDADIKDFAAATLPHLEHHLDMANALKAKLDTVK